MENRQLTKVDRNRWKKKQGKDHQKTKDKLVVNPYIYQQST